MKQNAVEIRAKAERIQETLLREGCLPIWVVHERPADFPDLFIARANVVISGEIQILAFHLEAPLLKELRDLLPRGLYRMDRQAGDEPQIVETWI